MEGAYRLVAQPRQIPGGCGRGATGRHSTSCAKDAESRQPHDRQVGTTGFGPHKMIRLAVASVLPLLAILPASGQVAATKRLTELKYPPLPALKPVLPERFQLPNGMTVFLLED